jgi:hypothetical protein
MITKRKYVLQGGVAKQWSEKKLHVARRIYI